MQFLIFCSSVFVFECWKFAMTDRSLLYTVVKASHTLIHKRKLVLPRRATYCWVFNFLRDRGRECLKQVQRKIIVPGLCPIFFYLHCMIESSDPIWNSAMGIGEGPYTSCRDIHAITKGGGFVAASEKLQLRDITSYIQQSIMHVILVHVDPFLSGGFDTNCILNRVSSPQAMERKEKLNSWGGKHKSSW